MNSPRHPTAGIAYLDRELHMEKEKVPVDSVSWIGDEFRKEVVERLSEETRKIPQHWIDSNIEQRLEVMDELRRNEEFRLNTSPIKYWRLPRLIVKLARLSQTMPGNMVVTVDNDEVQNSIKNGSFGQTFRATMGGSPVAVKYLYPHHDIYHADKSQIEWNLGREALILRFLSHENVIKFIGITDHPKLGPGIVFPWAERGSILQYINTCEIPPSMDERMIWLRDIARGLDYLHGTARIAHGDIKGRNILMTSDGTIKIGDFCLAVFVDGASFGSQRGGNPIWTPPENMWLQGPDSGWQRPTLSGDVYSFAITCVEILMGRVPWTNTQGLTWRVINGERPAIPSDTPQELASALPLWWHGDQIRRPSIQEIVAFFDHPVILPEQPDPRLKSRIFNPQNANFTPSDGLIDKLIKTVKKDETFIRRWAEDYQKQEDYPGCPVHILFDEKAFLTGLMKACGDDQELAGAFCYPALEIILERGRTVESRLLFLSQADQPSQSTHPIMSVGFEPICDTVNRAHERYKSCLDRINNLSSSASEPGTLVLFSGKVGWLQHEEFAKCLDELLRHGWHIELVIWANGAPSHPIYRTMSSNHMFSMARLESFYEYLFAE
ncbi:hypothetical protein QCA50_016330 [Cerrena zonata]|uniref:Protein kinase domain-containing protein n=1 Tax=Cerrena zonata TaxID=2478898 RepID=A0AAW0FLZ5_9APHY